MTTSELYNKIIDHAVKRTIFMLQDMGFSPVHMKDFLKRLNEIKDEQDKKSTS